MRALIKIIVGGALAAALAPSGSGCKKDSSAGAETCVPGSVRRCVGTWSCKGDQICSADGTQWSACACQPTVPGYDAGAQDGASTTPDAEVGERPATTPAESYLLVDDMEGSDAPNGPLRFAVPGGNASQGFWGSWRSSGDPSNRMSPDPYAYSPLPAAHETMAGVMSTHGAGLTCHIADLYGYCEQAFWLAQGPASSDAGAGSEPTQRTGNLADRVPVDLSAYRGLVFWAMASTPTRLKVVVEDADTDVLGGRCGQSDASADACGDAFSRPVSLTDTWKRYEVKLSDLSQEGWGHAAASGKLDPRTVYVIGFQVDGPQSSTAPAVDTAFWIDDVYLVEAAQASGSPLDAAAGADTSAVTCMAGSDELIADFQEDSYLNPADGRRGAFSVSGDSKGSFTPAVVENSAYPIDPDHGADLCSGPGSFHTKAVGFADWGAVISADLVPASGGKKGTYDASTYKGVSFWARAGAPLTGVKIAFPDVYTDGGADPGSVSPGTSPCVFQSGSKYNCSPYLVKLGDADFPAYKSDQIDTTWKRFDILFADTRQDFFNPGFHSADDRLDTKHLTSIAIQINSLYVNDVATPNDFELWIDDVYFIE